MARATGSGLGRVYWAVLYRVTVRVRVRVLGLGSDVCQGGGDRIVTLGGLFHLVGEKWVRVRVGLVRAHWQELYSVRVRVRVLGLGSDVCHGGGDRTVTLSGVFHLVGER